MQQQNKSIKKTELKWNCGKQKKKSEKQKSEKPQQQQLPGNKINVMEQKQKIITKKTQFFLHKNKWKLTNQK